MPTEPTTKRAVAFIDGQNLYHSAREAFGYPYPNYDVKKLAWAICNRQGWDLSQVRFYTGVPDRTDNQFWNQFWAGKLLTMSRQQVHIFKRSLRYRHKRIKLPNGSVYPVLMGEEKGIDVRIAIDVMRMAYRKEYDVALIFSQDQDLSEVADEIRVIAHEQDRWIKIAAAFPVSPTFDKRGIERTDWIRIDRKTYEACLDPRDYRAKGLPEDPKDK